MSEQQNQQPNEQPNTPRPSDLELPEAFNVRLQRHPGDTGYVWHVTKLNEREYPIGKPDEQPHWTTVEARLIGLGYEISHETQNGGQRVIQLVRQPEPDLLDKLTAPDTTSFELADEYADAKTAASDAETLRDMLKNKFGRL